MQDEQPASRIVKLTAAGRQLDAAIRMSLADEDVVAITTLAAAAYRVLRDLRTHQGHRVLEDQLKAEAVGVARALARGELSKREIEILSGDPAWDFIGRLADFIREIGPELSMDQLRDRVTMPIPPDLERKVWKTVNRIPNFLKHADSDPTGDIAESEIDPREMILKSCVLYSDLAGGVSPEMQVWYALEICTHADVRPTYEPVATMIKKFEATPAEWRKALAIEMIDALKELERSDESEQTAASGDQDA